MNHESFDISFIIKNIYIGDKKISLNKNHLDKLHIKSIVAVGE